MDFLLVKEGKQKIRRWWAPLAGINLLLVVLQTILGQYSSIAGTAWLWILLAVVPGSILLYGGRSLQQKLSSNLISKGSVRMLLSLTIAFLLLLLLTNLLSQAAVNSSDLGLKGYLWRSFLWLLPVNVLTVFSIWNLLLAPEKKLQVDAQLIQNYAADRGALVNEQAHPLRKQSLALIADNELKAVFELLTQYYNTPATQDDAMRNNLVVLQAEHTRLKEAVQLNTIEPEKAQRQFNRLTLALLEMSAELAA